MINKKPVACDPIPRLIEYLMHELRIAKNSWYSEVCVYCHLAIKYSSEDNEAFYKKSFNSVR